MQFENVKWWRSDGEGSLYRAELSPSVEGGVFMGRYFDEFRVGFVAFIDSLTKEEADLLETGATSVLEQRLREVAPGTYKPVDCGVTIVNGSFSTKLRSGVVLHEFAPFIRGENPIQTFVVDPPTEEDIAAHNKIVAQICGEE